MQWSCQERLLTLPSSRSGLLESDCRKRRAILRLCDFRVGEAVHARRPRCEFEVARSLRVRAIGHGGGVTRRRSWSNEASAECTAAAKRVSSEQPFGSVALPRRSHALTYLELCACSTIRSGARVDRLEDQLLCILPLLLLLRSLLHLCEEVLTCYTVHGTTGRMQGVSDKAPACHQSLRFDGLCYVALRVKIAKITRVTLLIDDSPRRAG